jgi:hypothetical protein
MATTSNAAMRKKTPFHVPVFRKQTTSLDAIPRTVSGKHRFVIGLPGRSA